MNLGKLIDVETYTQMGYSKEQVERAYEYSQKNRTDMFEALQQLQNQDRRMEQIKNKSFPPYSYLRPTKNVKLQDYEVIYSRSVARTSQLSREQIREQNNPVGLLNVSNCCYLNSLLQCYFLMGSFVREILIAEPLPQLPQKEPVSLKRIKNQYALMESFREMFSRMTISSKKYLNPISILNNLVNSVGEKIQYGDEKDLHEVNMGIVQRLSECLMYTKKYYLRSNEDVTQSKKIQRENIKKLFYGTKIQYMQGSEEKIQTEFMGIILNPGHSNIMSAMDDEFNYDVEIKVGETLQKKTFIKEIPEYIFFNISRAQFEQGGKQLHRNEEKMNIDFVIYLDRFMDQYREEGAEINPIILELTKKKNQLSRQLNYLEILTNKINECREYAKHLKGWDEKLPREEDIESEKKEYKAEIESIQEKLEKLQSRKEKYVLMYLFVHRGDATSGHYWGYGRNANHWYRFDVNVAKMKESEILVDMEKSNAIPYALVYAKESNIESFEYPFYLNLEENVELLGSKRTYYELIPEELKKKIVMENKQLHEFMSQKKSNDMLENLTKQYKIRYNLVKSQIEEYRKKKYKPPLTTNFSCYLASQRQEQLLKYSIFSVCLWSVAQMTPEELIKDEALLGKVQKAFRKKVKGKMALRHFVIEKEPLEGDKYRDHKMKYLLGKRYLKFINYLYKHRSSWPDIPEREGTIATIIDTFKSVSSLYLRNLTEELISIILIDLAKRQEVIFQEWVENLGERNPVLKEQLQCLTEVAKKEGEFIKPNYLRAEFENNWRIEDLKKNKDDHDIFTKLKQIISILKEGYQIYRINTKEKKTVGKKQEKLI